MTYNKIKTAGQMFSLWKKVSLMVLLGMVTLTTACLKEDIFPASGTPNDFMALVDVRNIYKGADVVLNQENMAGATRITGIVSSDASAGNFPKGRMAIQQMSRSITRGLEISFGDADVPFKQGDSVSITVSGASLVRRNGVLQVGVQLADVRKVAEQRPLEAIQVSLETLNSRFSNYEGVLIKLAHIDVVTAATTLEGDLSLRDLAGQTGQLHTEATALFAGQGVPTNASYVGIARYNNGSDGTEGAKQQLWPTNSAAITDQSGALYNNFPEDFENPDDALANAAGYSTKSGFFKTGSYTLTNVAIGKDANDYPVSGVTALRLNQNSTTSSWTAMNYDLPTGASKVTIWAGSYGASADLGSTWRLEYSQNQGLTWSQLGDDILTVSKTKEQFTFLMDIKGPVRFRVGKIGIGTSSTNNQNGRFSMDDLAIYENPGAGGPVTNPVPAYETVTAWQFGTPASAGTEAYANASTNHTGLDIAVLSRGAGLDGRGLVRTFNSAAIGTVIPSTKALAVTSDTYYQVSFQVKSGQKLSLSAIDTRIRRSAAGAKSHRWYYSLDRVTFKETNGSGDINFEGTDTEGQDMPTYYVYSTPELQNIPGGTTVTLRMYCWGFSNLNSGTFSIGRTAAGTTNSALRLGGKVEPQ